MERRRPERRVRQRNGRSGVEPTGEEWIGEDRQEWIGQESRGTEWQEGNVKERNGASRKGKE